jgi:DNA-binding transcriptional LysR family regulator
LAPTEAGLSFYERARRSIDEADEAELAARGAGRGLTGVLRISAAVTFARIHLVPHLPDFLALHPDLEMDMVLDDRHVDLVQEGIDVALRMGQLADSALTARRIASCRNAVVGTPAYFGRVGEPKEPSDLAAHEVVVYAQPAADAVWTFQRNGAECLVAMRGRLRTTAAEGVRAAVLAGAGIAITSEWMFAPELADGTVKTVLKDWGLPSIDLWAVFPAGRTASTKARTFIRFVEDLMHRQRAGMEGLSCQCTH